MRARYNADAQAASPRARTAWRYFDGTFKLESEKREFYGKISNVMGGGWARAAQRRLLLTEACYRFADDASE